jgi:hypothetical protein
MILWMLLLYKKGTNPCEEIIENGSFLNLSSLSWEKRRISL